MDNEEQLQRIKNRLSLREPLQEALDIVAQVSEDLTLSKLPDNEDEAVAFLKTELDKVKNSFTTCPIVAVDLILRFEACHLPV